MPDTNQPVYLKVTAASLKALEEEAADALHSGRGHDPKTWKVGQIMRADVIFCHEDDECACAQRMMEGKGLSCLPVVKRERCASLGFSAVMRFKPKRGALPWFHQATHHHE